MKAATTEAQPMATSQGTQLKSGDTKDKGTGNVADPGKSAFEHRHKSMYEVLSVPALHSHYVPLKEKIKSLKCLKYEDFVCVRQYFEDVEEVAGFRMSNVYAVGITNRFSFDPEEENHMFYIGEKISCEMAWLKTSSRSVVFRVLAKDGEVVCYFSRECLPCYCLTNLCTCLSKQSLKVTLPDGRHFGTVRKQLHFVSANYAVFNSENKKIFDVLGPTSGNICPCWLVSNSVIWKLHPCAGESESAAFIQKTRSPICMETNYSVNFERSMDVKIKMLLVALVILIDFQHFKRCSTLCQVFTWLLWVVAICAGIACAFIFFVICERKGLVCRELTTG